MAKFHLPTHFKGPLELEKGSSLKSKLIMTTTRDIVLAILEGKKSVELKKYNKKLDLHHPPKNPGKKKNVLFTLPSSLHAKNVSPFKKDEHHHHTAILKKSVKDTIHNGLRLVGIHKGNTDDRITKALTTLDIQYKNMSRERFLHRWKNGKIYRDAHFILGMVKYMPQIGPLGFKNLLDILSSPSHSRSFQNLYNSEAIKTMSSFIIKAREVIVPLKGEKGFQYFMEEIKKYSE